MSLGDTGDVADTNVWSILLGILAFLLLAWHGEALVPWIRTWWFRETTGRVIETSVSPDSNSEEQEEESDEEEPEGLESEPARQSAPILAEPFDFLADQEARLSQFFEPEVDSVAYGQDEDEDEESEYEDEEYRLEMAEAKVLEQERMEEEESGGYVVEHLVSFHAWMREYTCWVRGFCIPSPEDPQQWNDLAGYSIQIEHWRLNPNQVFIRRFRSGSHLRKRNPWIVFLVAGVSLILAMVLS